MLTILNQPPLHKYTPHNTLIIFNIIIIFDSPQCPLSLLQLLTDCHNGQPTHLPKNSSNLHQTSPLSLEEEIRECSQNFEYKTKRQSAPHYIRKLFLANRLRIKHHEHSHQPDHTHSFVNCLMSSIDAGARWS